MTNNVSDAGSASFRDASFVVTFPLSHGTTVGLGSGTGSLLPETKAACADPDKNKNPMRPVDRVERFPTEEGIRAALDLFEKDPRAARAAKPMSLAQFFGLHDIASANIHSLHIEQLHPGNDRSARPIAFLSAHFYGSDLYWNDRFKDVALYNLFRAVGITNVFPESRFLTHEGRALVRIWTDYTPLAKGAPKDMRAEDILGELAKIAIVSYVSGNVDGPAHNPNNGGFAKFRDADGNERWGGVVIDNGASFNDPHESHKPWNARLLGRDLSKLEEKDLPRDLVNGLRTIAGSTRTDLARKAGFPFVDDGAKRIVENKRTRAREVLDFYRIDYKLPDG